MKVALLPRLLLSLTISFSLFFLLTPSFSLAANSPAWTKTSLVEVRPTSVIEVGDSIFVGSLPYCCPSQGGVKRSTDGGQTWEQVGLSGVIVEDLISSGNAIFAANSASASFYPIGIYRSKDNGQTWQNVLSDKGGFLSFAKTGNTIFAGSSGYGGVYASSDGGETWQQRGLLGFFINHLAASDTALFALAQIDAHAGSGLYRSIDGGNSWTLVSLGQPYSGLFADNQVVLAAMGTTLLRSTNGGASFQSVANVPNLGNGTLGPITSDGKNYYLGNWRALNVMTGGVLRSSDGGLTWQAMNDGLSFTGPSSSMVTALGYSGKYKKLFLAGFNQGLWEYPVGSTLPPIIIIPGFPGTEIIHRETGDVRWIDPEKLLTSLSDDFLDALKLQSDAKTSVDNKWISGKVLEGIDFSIDVFDQHFYDILKKYFINLGYKENENLFLFGYDWRRDLSNPGWPAGENTTQDRLDTLVSSLSDKPIIITHSTGSLVARQFILDPVRAAKVSKLITMGGPWQGLPGAFGLLHYGWMNDVPFVNAEEARKIVNNFPALYELLPTSNYFQNYETYFIDQTDRDGDGITGPLNFSQMQSLISRMHNPNALALASSFHNQGIGDWSRIGTNGMKVYHVVGTGSGTPGVLREWYETTLFGQKKRKQSFSCINGDNTVPFHSANIANTVANQQVYYANDVIHAALPVNPDVEAFIGQIVRGELVLENNVISKTPRSTFSGTCLHVFSPVAVHVYDQTGHHTGPAQGGVIQTGIPNSSYYILDESKTVILPAGNYSVNLAAEGTGTFDLVVDQISSGNTTKSVLFNDVPIASTSAAARLTLGVGGTVSDISLDRDGDSKIDETIVPDSSLSGEATKDMEPPKTTIALTGHLGKNDWYVSTVSATLSASDASGSGVLETKYRIGDGEVKKYSEPFHLATEGQATISAQSIDKAGNTENPKQKNVRIDTYPPTLALISPALFEFTLGDSLTVRFTASDPTSGVATASAWLGTTMIADGQTVPLTDVGKQTLILTAMDNAGNQASQSAELDVLLPVNVEIKPEKINLDKDAKDIKVTLTIPSSYDPNTVDTGSILLDRTVPLQVENAKVKDKKGKLILKSDGTALAAYLKQKNPDNKQTIPITITGRFAGGIGFVGKEQIVVKIKAE